MSDRDQQSDVENATSLPKRTDAERRDARTAVFRDWFTGQAKTLAKLPPSTMPSRDGIDDRILSVKEIMAKTESQVIIGNPREYQTQIFEVAKQQNTIAVLDTGSGKTLIAVLLLRFVANQELEDRFNDKAPRISFFLVDKVILVFQQHAVLQANLSHKTEKFCGAMGCDLWTASTWEKVFEENMIVVCTADVLHHCLSHGFISMNQINLLIFDEVHHAKKGHAYVRIINSFYHPAAGAKRPRIFGMTASPMEVNVRCDVVTRALELETLLDAKIATTSDLALLQHHVSRPEELIVEYPPPTPVTDPSTPLWRELRARWWDVNGFERLFDNAKTINQELGPWCSDKYWTFAFSDAEAKKAEARLQRDFRENKVHSKQYEEEAEHLRQAQDFISNHDFSLPQSDSSQLSPKVLRLYETLRHYFGHRTNADARCIVFTDRRSTARLLDAVAHLGGPYLRSSILIGSASLNFDGIRNSLKDQVLTSARFRTGEINCLFATSVAEEGVDIRDCNLVIRFDLCKTMIQYIQSRGRARHHDSKLIHLMERGNHHHVDALSRIRNAEARMRKFCEALPGDRLLDKKDRVVVDRAELFRIPLGATLTWEFALVVLAHFVNALPSQPEDDRAINYVFTIESGKHICEVILPSRSPLLSLKGKSQANKSSAKRAVAFAACIWLYKHKYLDKNLMPQYSKHLPKMRNALLALDNHKKAQYDMISKPRLWELDRGSLPEKLYLTRIVLVGEWDLPVKPIGLLTRGSMPLCLEIPVFGSSGGKSMVRLTSYKIPVKVNSRYLDALTTFTLTVFKDVFAKEFACEPADFSYWFAPLLDTVASLHKGRLLEDRHGAIDWKILADMNGSTTRNWIRGTAEDALVDKFLVDPGRGGRRFFTTATSNLEPVDLIPSGEAPHKLHSSAKTILDYSVNRAPGERDRHLCILDQPVLKAKLCNMRLNFLAPPHKHENHLSSSCYICPEPMEISPLSTRHAAMARLLAAVLHRIESYELATDLMAELGLDVPPALGLEAITKDSNNVQMGMGPNYERLEFIGDCFLKLATTMATYAKKTDADEFTMHCDRMVMLCNKNLFTNCKKGEWYKYIRCKAFDRRTWYPVGLRLIKGKAISKPHMKQDLSDKTVADVCEALIGAALMSKFTSGGADPRQFDQAVKAVTTFVMDSNHDMQAWSDYHKALVLPRQLVTGQTTAAQRQVAVQVQAFYDYNFKNPLLLMSAFQHPSFPTSWTGLPSYQRMEFLGDAALDMAAVTFLCQHSQYAEHDEQWLTEHKMAMVSNRFLATLCVKIGFHRHLLHNMPALAGRVQAFVEQLGVAQAQAGDDARDYWIDVKSAPKCLSDVVESFVGAIFVDSEFDYREVQRFFDTHIKWFFEDMSIYDRFANEHPVTKLTTALAVELHCNDWSLMAAKLPSADGSVEDYMGCLIVHSKVIAQGRDVSGSGAKTAAAQKAGETLLTLSLMDFRDQYGCDCGNKK